VLEHDVEHHEAVRTRGYAYENQGNFSKAYVDFVAFVETVQATDPCNDRLALVYYDLVSLELKESGSLSKAEKWWDKAQQADQRQAKIFGPLVSDGKAEASKIMFMKALMKCHHCNSLADHNAKLLQCAGCNIARYCSRECQKAAWKSGHKMSCREMRDS